MALAGKIPGVVRPDIIGGVCRGWQVLVSVLGRGGVISPLQKLRLVVRDKSIGIRPDRAMLPPAFIGDVCCGRQVPVGVLGGAR